jgi:hypothetical protein
LSAVKPIGYNGTDERGNETVKGKNHEDNLFAVWGVIVGAKGQPKGKPGQETAKEKS